MSKTSFSEEMRLATNSKFTLPLKNSSRVDRVHASEKHKLKRYLEGSLEDIEARQAADTKAFDPVKILEKSNLAKNYIAPVQVANILLVRSEWKLAPTNIAVWTLGSLWHIPL